MIIDALQQEIARGAALALWRRLDTPGHDALRLQAVDGGWELEGTAVFRHEGAPALLAYRVTCDTAWRTREGRVHGWLGAKPVALDVAREAAGSWTLDGKSVPELASCVDLDLGFTPATNLLSLRRVALPVGQAADVPVAWLDVSAGTLAFLPQRYVRRTPTTYWYESPTHGYAALLEVTPAGIVCRYPRLWELEG